MSNSMQLQNLRKLLESFPMLQSLSVMVHISNFVSFIILSSSHNPSQGEVITLVSLSAHGQCGPWWRSWYPDWQAIRWCRYRWLCQKLLDNIFTSGIPRWFIWNASYPVSPQECSEPHAATDVVLWISIQARYSSSCEWDEELWSGFGSLQIDLWVIVHTLCTWRRVNPSKVC